MYTSQAEPDRLYIIHEKDDSRSFGVSPDGEGFYFYDTLKEARRQHGDIPAAHISAKDFDTMRFGPEYDLIDADIEFEEYGEW